MQGLTGVDPSQATIERRSNLALYRPKPTWLKGYDSAKPEKGKYEEDNYNKAHEVNDAVH
jgi:hypothetical protein